MKLDKLDEILDELDVEEPENKLSDLVRVVLLGEEPKDPEWARKLDA